MTAATAAQVLDKKGSRPIQEAIETGMKANTIAYHGTIAVIDAGYMAPGRAATGLIAVGFFEPGGNDETLTGYDNTNATTGGAAGAINGYARPGCKKLQNSGTDPVAQADVGKTASSRTTRRSRRPTMAPRVRARERSSRSRAMASSSRS